MLSILTALAICLSLLPTAAGAEETMDPVEYLDAEGELQTCTNYTEDVDTSTWEAGWYVMSTNGMAKTITISGDVHLILADGCVWGVSGIQGDGSLTVYGQSTENPGSLAILFSDPADGKHCGINIKNFTMNGGAVGVVEKLDNNGNVVASEPTENRNSYAIYVDKLTMNGGSLEVVGSTAKGDDLISCGIYANNVTVSGGEIKAKSGTANEDNSMSCGIYANNVTVNGGKIEAGGGAVTGFEEDDYGTSTGIYAECGDVTVNGGDISAVGADDVTWSYGILTEDGDVYVNDGTVKAVGGKAKYNESRTSAKSVGIETCYITITGGDVTTTGCDATGESSASPESHGIYAYNEVDISGGKVTASGGNSEFSAGIFGWDAVTISGGDITANGGTVSKYSVDKYLWANSYGLASWENVTINGGHIKAVGGTVSGSTNSGSAGIYTDMSLTIADGTITAFGGNNANKSCGIETSEMTVEDGSVTATGGTAINASYGIHAAYYHASSDTTPVTAPRITISGGNVSATGSAVTDEAGKSYGLSAKICKYDITGGWHVTGETEGKVRILGGSLVAESQSETGASATNIKDAANLDLTGSYQWRTSADGAFTGGDFAMPNQAPAYLEIESKNVAYGIIINGTPVTEENKGNVLGNGAISYDPNNNTITVSSYLSGLVIKGNGSTDIVISNGVSNTPSVGALTVTGAKNVTVTSNNNYQAVNPADPHHCSCGCQACHLHGGRQPRILDLLRVRQAVQRCRRYN